MPTKSFHRTDRVSAQIRRDLGTIVHAAVRDHGLPSVSVSDVEVTRDLAHAKVFVTALMQERSAEAVKGLKELAPQLRSELARAMKLRHVPELHFHYDDSVDRGERIDNLLRDMPELQQEQEQEQEQDDGGHAADDADTAPRKD
ncbi:30S ribosome-binding factor RbfA [Xanthomonas sacchari]|uniref:30S ribosome-binding factor RbfA n=2 Tax=Xanthomonas TaxID=338 RepID=UPI00224F3E96|nr:30S ribosome-binding factor RbfA [Xanthomonas sacchari]MCW0412741.1 Ribosome-binding factor A [Xanthomonas sacchari]UYK65411.1 30S ribosome-binding factor RbfA [Xanthomonas sacchari]